MATLLLLCSISPAAHAATAPEAIVQGLYAPYMKYTAAEGDKLPNSTDVVKNIASARLKALLQKEEDCVKKTQEVCAIDGDIIIDAQDWALSDLKIHSVRESADSSVVQADFMNLGKASRVTYFFIKEDKQWKIDDIAWTEEGAERKLSATLKSPI